MAGLPCRHLPRPELLELLELLGGELRGGGELLKLLLGLLRERCLESVCLELLLEPGLLLLLRLEELLLLAGELLLLLSGEVGLALLHQLLLPRHEGLLLLGELLALGKSRPALLARCLLEGQRLLATELPGPPVLAGLPGLGEVGLAGQSLPLLPGRGQVEVLGWDVEAWLAGQQVVQRELLPHRVELSVVVVVLVIVLTTVVGVIIDIFQAHQ